MLVGGATLGVTAPAMATPPTPPAPTLTLSAAYPKKGDAVTLTSTLRGCGQGNNASPGTVHFNYAVWDANGQLPQNAAFTAGTFSGDGSSFTVSKTFAPGTFTPGNYTAQAYGNGAPCYSDPNNFVESAYVHFRVVTVPSAPSRPTVVAGNHSLTISWKATAQADGYQFTTNGGKNWSRRTTALTATATGFPNGGVHQVRVRALDGPLIGPISLATAARVGAPAVILPPTVRQGSKGPVVQRLQLLLGIRADGIFGRQTLLVVQGYQAAHYLAADGIVGAATWKSLLHV